MTSKIPVNLISEEDAARLYSKRRINPAWMAPDMFYWAMVIELGQMQLYESVAGLRFPEPLTTAVEMILHKEERMQGYYERRKAWEDEMIKKIRKMKD